MSERLKMLADVLERYFQWRAQEEAARPPDEYQLRRAQRAKEYWLANGLVKRSRYPS